MEQWASLARYSSTSGAASLLAPDTLSIDVYDHNNDAQRIGTLGSAAMINSTVIAVLGDGLVADVFTPFATAASLPVLSLVPGLGATVEGTSTFSLQAPLLPIQTFISLCAKHSWRRIAFIHDGETTSLTFRQQLRQVSGVQLIDLPIVFEEDPLAHTLATLQRLSVNVIAVSTSNSSYVTQLFADAQKAQLFIQGKAWIYLQKPHEEPVSSSPFGTLFVSPVDAPLASRTSFTTTLQSLNAATYPRTGTGATLEFGTILAHDAVQLLASALGSAATRSRLGLLSELSTTTFTGVSGDFRFDSFGQRVMQHAEVRFATPSGLTLSMDYNGATLTTILPPTFPGGTTIPADDEMDFIPLATIWSLTANLYPAGTVPFVYATIRYANDWLNNQTDLLAPKTKFAVSLLDDMGFPSTAVKYSLDALEAGTAAIIGGMTPTLCVAIQGAISGHHVPHISSAISSPTLSNKVLYPTFMRVVPSSDHEGVAVIAMARHFGWTDLTFVSTTDSTGTSITEVALAEAAAHGINIEHHFILTPGLENYDKLAEEMKKARPEPRITLFFISYESTRHVWEALHRSGIKLAAVVVVDTFPFDIPLWGYAPNIPASFFHGWIITGPAAGIGTKYARFVAETEQASDPRYSGTNLIAPLIPSYFDSLSIVASAIKKLKAAGGDPRNGTQLQPLLLDYKGELLTGDLEFTPEGDRTPSFDVRNIIVAGSSDAWGKQIPVARYTDTHGLVFSPSATVVWPDGTTKVPVSSLPRELNWLKWRSGAGIALSITAFTGIAVSAAIFVIFLYFRESSVLRSSTFEFLLLMLIGIAMGFGSALVWIGRPTDWICAMRIWIPPVAFLLILAPLLAKTWRLHRIFTLADIGVTPIRLSTLILIVIALTIAQIIICVFWIAFGTIKPIIVNDPTDRSQAYVLCGSAQPNRISAYVTYAYIGTIIVAGCYLAFRVRKLPKDFNESIWIARAMGNIMLFAGLIIILGYSLSKHYVVVLILIVVCTLAICLGSLILMMTPKLWSLYMYPQKRSSGRSSGRTGSSSFQPPRNARSTEMNSVGHQESQKNVN